MDDQGRLRLLALSGLFALAVVIALSTLAALKHVIVLGSHQRARVLAGAMGLLYGVTGVRIWGREASFGSFGPVGGALAGAATEVFGGAQLRKVIVAALGGEWGTVLVAQGEAFLQELAKVGFFLRKLGLSVSRYGKVVQYGGKTDRC